MRTYGICLQCLAHFLPWFSPDPSMLSQRVGAPFCCVVFHRVNVPQFSDPLVYWCALRLHTYLTIVNCAAMNIGVCRFFWIGVSGFWGNSPSNGIAGSTGSSIFRFLRKFHTIFNSGSTSLQSHLGFPFLHNLASTCYLLIGLWWPFWPLWSGISL